MSSTVISRAITVNAVKEVLEDIVANNPDRADPRVEEGMHARYVHHGRPNCLVAHTLTRLGFSMSVLRALDREHGVGNVVDAGVPLIESRHPALRRIDPLALRLLDFVQARQDDGERWASVVRDAFHRHRYFGEYWDRKRKPWLFGIREAA